MRPARVFDASVFIAAQRGSRSALDAVGSALRATPGSVVVPTIAVLEYRSAPRVPARWRAWFEGVVSTLGTVSLDVRAARLGARAARHAARAGRRLSPADAAVVGCGAVYGASVIVTADGDFDGIPGFTVERVAPAA